MPVMNGNESTRRIRKLENKKIASIPILGLTANVRAEQQTEMEKAGIMVLFTSHIKQKTLSTGLHNWWRKHQVLLYRYQYVCMYNTLTTLNRAGMA